MLELALATRLPRAQPAQHAHAAACPVVCTAGSYAQSVSFLLMTWALLGWLLPTLAIIPFEPAFEAPQQPELRGAGRRAAIWRLPSVACSRLEAAVEAWLRRLLPLPAPPRRPGDEPPGEPAFGTSCVLCWLVTLCALWLVCCTVAPLYSAGSDAPLVGGA